MEDAGLDTFEGKPCDGEAHKHMTLVWRKSPAWTPEEIAELQKECDEWKAKNCKHDRVEFSLTRWGPRSCLIHGPLFDLCDHLLKLQDKRAPIGEQRPTHVELFKPPASTAAKVFIIKTAACIDLEDTGLDTFEGKPCDGEAAQATT